METPDEDVVNPCRTHRVNRDGEGESLGVALWINADELREMGIDADRVDRVGFFLDDGAPDFVRHE